MVPIYMKFGDIRGDVTEATHENWIELQALNWEVVRPATNPTGSGAGRAIAAARISELAVVKTQDVATIALIQESLSGRAQSVTIDFVRTGTEKGQVYYSIALREALVTSFRQNSGGDRPTESMALNYTKISFTGTQMDTDGKATSPASFGWSVTDAAPA